MNGGKEEDRKTRRGWMEERQAEGWMPGPAYVGLVRGMEGRAQPVLGGSEERPGPHPCGT